MENDANHWITAPSPELVSMFCPLCRTPLIAGKTADSHIGSNPRRKRRLRKSKQQCPVNSLVSKERLPWHWMTISLEISKCKSCQYVNTTPGTTRSTLTQLKTRFRTLKTGSKGDDHFHDDEWVWHFSFSRLRGILCWCSLQKTDTAVRETNNKTTNLHQSTHHTHKRSARSLFICQISIKSPWFRFSNNDWVNTHNAIVSWKIPSTQ